MNVQKTTLEKWTKELMTSKLIVVTLLICCTILDVWGDGAGWLWVLAVIGVLDEL